MNHVVVDVEIVRTIEQTEGGWNATDKLGVGVACLWDHTSRRMRIIGGPGGMEPTPPGRLLQLRKRLLEADRITGFNIWGFDYPVIWGISKPAWLTGGGLVDTGMGTTTVEELKARLLPKTDDILRRIWQALGLNADKFSPRTHGGWKLDAVADATLGFKKIGHGADAPKWYQAGKVADVANYCADDVAIERDLGDFVERYGYVLHPSKGRLDIGIRWEEHKERDFVPPAARQSEFVGGGGGD